MIKLIKSSQHIKKLLGKKLTLLLIYGNSKFTIGEGDCVEDARYYCRIYYPRKGIAFYKMESKNAASMCAEYKIKKIPAFLFFKDKKLIKVLYGPQTSKVLKIELGLVEY